ncbi:MAG: hypothetical protein ACJ0Q6_00320 [Candidatus Azotimanducaceae bacterium]
MEIAGTNENKNTRSTGLEVSIFGLGAMYSGKPMNSGTSDEDMDFEVGSKTIELPLIMDESLLMPLMSILAAVQKKLLEKHST